ncbi:hypothetical protein [Holospora undulata]|uniref:Uncharacterized protein n=2 Tax=Holospora TaxID=44747 RepID=A0A061JG87_9PROT|nr:hypothetical protein [Holospora undulata]ETZ04971.1 hypothetical protein K737_300616 [Holospora undulata HU1]GAJ46650.1 hypothetical protein HE1_00988 [Holospora elegans E1]
MSLKKILWIFLIFGKSGYAQDSGTSLNLSVPELPASSLEKDGTQGEKSPDSSEEPPASSEKNETSDNPENSGQNDPPEEPLSKETQQEKELYELNAYFDNYMDPRPFAVGSTEF